MTTMNPPETARTGPTAGGEVLTPGPPDEPVATPLDRPYRLTVSQYFELIARGFIQKRDPVYLWKGRLVEKMVKGRAHSFAVGSLDDALTPLKPAGYYIDQEQPMMVGNEGAPEPDLMVVRGTRRDHQKNPPAASRDVALVVEVADSSLAEDLGDVLQTYAAEAIPVYWVVNLRARRIEVYTEPTGPVERPYYRAIRLYGPDDELPVVIDGREVGRIAVKDILP